MIVWPVRLDPRMTLLSRVQWASANNGDNEKWVFIWFGTQKNWRCCERKLSLYFRYSPINKHCCWIVSLFVWFYLSFLFLHILKHTLTHIHTSLFLCLFVDFFVLSSTLLTFFPLFSFFLCVVSKMQIYLFFFHWKLFFRFYFSPSFDKSFYN